MKIILEVEAGPNQGRSFEFARPDVFLVGRSADAHLTASPDDKSVSRRHCLLEIAPPRCYVRDLGSTNGTLVNGKKVLQAELRHEDRITIGRTVLRVVRVDEQAAAAGCLLCGEAFAEGGGPSICGRCRAESLEPVLPHSPGRAPAVPASCAGCSTNLASVANLDGLAGAFQEEAQYLCPNCADARFNLYKPRKCGDLRLLRQLGSGGMGVVFLAWDPRTMRLGALKKISIPFPDELSLRRFQREIRIMAGLVHPHIVRLFRQGTEENSPFLFSEYLDGGSLADRALQEGGRLPIGQACRWMAGALLGLEHFHASGHVHRDLKPANILLRKSPSGSPEIPKLADFGLAKSLTVAGGTILTQPNDTCGSIPYTAPEQIVSYITAGPLADIYSMGVSLYQILSGSLPFWKTLKGAATWKDVLVAVLEGKARPVRELRPAIPEALAAIVTQAIQKNPAYRFHSAGEFREALEAFLATWKEPA